MLIAQNCLVQVYRGAQLPHAAPTTHSHPSTDPTDMEDLDKMVSGPDPEIILEVNDIFLLSADDTVHFF